MSAPRLRDIDPRMATPPDGLEYGHFKNADGAAIRYAVAPPPADRLVNGQPTGVVVLVTGFRESTERYYERIREHQERGEIVYTMDWRGQGGSQRYNKNLPQRPGAQGYEHDAADLEQFITEVAKIEERHPGLPKTLHAHSMGGNIALRYLHDYPGRVDNAVITSPMLEIKTGIVPQWVARQVASVVSYFDKFRYMPGEGDWNEAEALGDIKDNKINERVIRQSLQDLFYRDMPDKRLGGATAGWFVEACRSMSVLRDSDYLKQIKTPVMLVAGRLDDLVNPKAIIRAAHHLPNATLQYYRRAGHSPWMESNLIRKKLWGQVDTFLEQQRDSTTPAPAKSVKATQDRPNPDPGMARRLTSGPEARETIKPGTSATATDWQGTAPSNERNASPAPAKRHPRVP